MAEITGNLMMEDARVVFRNFAGKEGQYNREGDRNFCVLLEPELAEQMAADGWNIKTLKPREPGDEGTPYIQVSVGFKGRPPAIWLISSKGRVALGQHECELLDWVDFKKVDLIVRPYNWLVNGKSGVKAYLKTIFVTLDEDYLELKYSEVPVARALESGASNSIEATDVLLALPAGTQDPSEGEEEIFEAELVDD